MFQVRIRGKKAPRWLSLILVGITPFGLAQTPRPGSDPLDAANIVRPFFSGNCYTCHGSKTKMAGMDLEAYASQTSILEDRATGQSVLRMLRSGLMPPSGIPRPNEADLRAVIKRLEDVLETNSAAAKPDSATAAIPDPGNVPPHRGDGTLKPGRHIIYPETPMTNLYLTLLEKMGAHTEKLGDSTGQATHLSDV
jgi:mono/diheme cytochrome c family protein